MQNKNDVVMPPFDYLTGPIGKTRRPRWFYVWGAPLFWLVPIALLWQSAITEPPGSHGAGLAISLAEFPILWLVDRIHPKTNTECAIASCVIGTCLAAVIGLVQDLLRVFRPRLRTAICGAVLFVALPWSLLFMGMLLSSKAIMNAGGGILLLYLVGLPNLVLAYGAVSIVICVPIAMLCDDWGWEDD